MNLQFSKLVVQIIFFAFKTAKKNTLNGKINTKKGQAISGKYIILSS